MTPDIINAMFHFCGGWFILLHILTLRKDKSVRGVNTLAAAFFCTWGAWNIYFYPHLEQLWSFAAGIFIFLMNAVWVGQMIYYKRKEAT